MHQPRLLIRKAVLNMQGKTRPVVQVQADVSPKLAAMLSEHFLTENLFKRSSYAQGWPEGVPLPPAPLAPHLAAFVKNDACPEVTVKTLLAGQMHQAGSLWEALAFIYVAERAFDSLMLFAKAVIELGTETSYTAPDTDILAFVTDTVAESEAAGLPPAALESAVAVANAA